MPKIDLDFSQKNAPAAPIGAADYFQLIYFFLPVTRLSIATNAQMASITAKMPIMPLSVSKSEGASVSGDQANFMAFCKNIAFILLYQSMDSISVIIRPPAITLAT